VIRLLWIRSPQPSITANDKAIESKMDSVLNFLSLVTEVCNMMQSVKVESEALNLSVSKRTCRSWKMWLLPLLRILDFAKLKLMCVCVWGRKVYGPFS
jgi:hypothetical protein